MNTPFHGLLATTLLGRNAGPAVGWAAFAGGIAPDVPAAIFYGWYCLLGGHTGIEIWEEKYIGNGWDLVADLTHSIVLAGLLVSIAAWRRWWPVAAFAGGAVLHGLLDMVTHAEHAHRHLLPLTEWRLITPFSYWNRAQGAAFLLAAEGVALTICAVVCWRRYRHPAPRAGIVILLLWAVYWVASGRAFFQT